MNSSVPPAMANRNSNANTTIITFNTIDPVFDPESVELLFEVEDDPPEAAVLPEPVAGVAAGAIPSAGGVPRGARSGSAAPPSVGVGARKKPLSSSSLPPPDPPPPPLTNFTPQCGHESRFGLGPRP